MSTTKFELIMDSVAVRENAIEGEPEYYTGVTDEDLNDAINQFAYGLGLRHANDALMTAWDDACHAVAVYAKRLAKERKDGAR